MRPAATFTWSLWQWSPLPTGGSTDMPLPHAIDRLMLNGARH